MPTKTIKTEMRAEFVVERDVGDAHAIISIDCNYLSCTVADLLKIERAVRKTREAMEAQQ